MSTRVVVVGWLKMLKFVLQQEQVVGGCDGDDVFRRMPSRVQYLLVKVQAVDVDLVLFALSASADLQEKCMMNKRADQSKSEFTVKTSSLLLFGSLLNISAPVASSLIRRYIQAESWLVLVSTLCSKKCDF